MEGICQQSEDPPDLSNGGMVEVASIEHRSNIEGTSNDSILKPEHKIFLSHSGAQKEFVWHLCEALQQRGHIPFFDKLQSSLPKGEQFSELILKAAHQCEMAVVVVSEEYFMSKWPMIELHAFVQATKRKSNIKLKILPLFYRLSVSEFLDEKRQRRWFQKWESWAKDDPKERIKVGEWKEALNLLKSYNGILYNQELQDILSYQNNIVSNICGSIVPDIKWNDSHIQGKSNILKVVNEKIEKIGHLHDCKANVVGIYGVGGIGKTTLCKILCNELSGKYKGRTCHVELKSSYSSWKELLQKILIELIGFSSEGLQQLDAGECEDILRTRISSQVTFLALDNVWDDSLSLKHGRMVLEAPYNKGSLVIVTARSKSLLELLGVHGDACIEMPELGDGDAMNLLYHVAPGKQFITEEEKHDILWCIKRCYFQKGDEGGFHYHPLALEALGLQLRNMGNKPSEWVKNLPRAKNFTYFAGENPVFDIMRSSFDLLPLTERSLFLDLLLYRPFKVDRCDVGPRVVEVMEWLCLVYKEVEDKIRSRLDRLKGKGLLQDVDLRSGTISVHDLYIELANLEVQVKLNDSTDLEDRRWVKIRNGDELTEFDRTPSGGCWLKLDRLSISQDDWSCPPPIGSLEGIEWQRFPNIVILDLWGLHLGQETLNLKGLKCLRSLCLHNIRGLDRVEGLEGLKNLSYFKWLGVLHYGGDDTGTRIGQFPASLRVLRIEGFIWLSPDMLARCNNLRKLTLSCIQADNLDLSNCLSLQSVTLEDARIQKLQFLSEPITGRCASSLQSLQVSRCETLAEIPGLDHLIGLERLVLRRCSMIKELPDLQNLTKLQFLELEGRGLKRKRGLEVGGYCILPQLREHRYRCRVENEIPNLNHGLERLQVLAIHRCSFYEHLEGLGGLPALRRLTFNGCRIFSRLPDLSKSRNLEELELKRCEMELCEEDICILASLPLLQPVLIITRRLGSLFKLDVVRRKMLRQGFRTFEWEESDLGTPPIKIGNSDDEDEVEWSHD